MTFSARLNASEDGVTVRLSAETAQPDDVYSEIVLRPDGNAEAFFVTDIDPERAREWADRLVSAAESVDDED